MHFQRLRLSGFKSFVDPTEFRIEPGVTGIVGPNGCGKSNLLEALRWVMGANSAKAMRAEGMDDVIFGGTGARPPRNHAEVILTIDNAERRAPPQFNGHDTLEVSRRIDRGSGSTYRINGVEARSRDVQLLFADASTGANSPALVRQGQISELIGAKPSNRRRILEEAAGDSGLHSRRHEADLRLKAENDPAVPFVAAFVPAFLGEDIRGLDPCVGQQADTPGEAFEFQEPPHVGHALEAHAVLARVEGKGAAPGMVGDAVVGGVEHDPEALHGHEPHAGLEVVGARKPDEGRGVRRKISVRIRPHGLIGTGLGLYGPSPERPGKGVGRLLLLLGMACTGNEERCRRS